jgi:gliding motility-associated-like protein
LYVPNIFTPNNDGVNDWLYVRGDSIKQIISMDIKDKLGGTVFHFDHSAFESHPGWDGTGPGSFD